MVRLIVAASLLALGAGGCRCSKSSESGRSSPPSTSAEPDGRHKSAQPEILIGEVSALSGPESSFGRAAHKGIELAVRELNASGGVKGRLFRVKVVDDSGDVEKAAQAAESLVLEDGAVLLVGEAASSRSIAMAAVAERLQVPMISHSSTNPRVTEGKRFVFRVCFTDPFQGYAMARFARENLKLGRVAILRDETEYASGLAGSFETRFEGMGGKVVQEATYAPGAADFATQLAVIRAAKPEAIYIPGYYSEVQLAARQARSLGVQAILLGGDGWNAIGTTDSEALEGSYYTDHYSTQDPWPRTQRFVAEYRSAYGEEPNSSAALAYDALKVAALAVARAPNLSGSALRDAIAMTREFDGVTGTITIDARHDATKPAVVVRRQNQQPVFQTAIPPEAPARPSAARHR